MVVGTFPTTAGIPSRCTNLEMFTYKMWKHDAVSMCQYQRVCACGQRRPSALVTKAGDRSRGVGKILSGPDFCGYDDIQIIADIHTQ